MSSVDPMISHNIHCADLFPVPLMIDNFGEAARALNRALIVDIDREMSRAPTSGRSFESGWQSQPGLETRYESFSHLRQQIERSALAYLQHIRFAEPHTAGCRGLWANFMTGRGSHSELHIHGSGQVIATGVYYPASLSKDVGTEPTDLDHFDP